MLFNNELDNSNVILNSMSVKSAICIWIPFKRLMAFCNHVLSHLIRPLDISIIEALSQITSWYLHVHTSYGRCPILAKVWTKTICCWKLIKISDVGIIIMNALIKFTVYWIGIFTKHANYLTDVMCLFKFVSCCMNCPRTNIKYLTSKIPWKTQACVNLISQVRHRFL